MCLRECDIRNLLSNLCKDSVIFNDHDIKETCPPGSLIRTLTAVGSVDSGSSGISFTRSIFCCWINATLKSKSLTGEKREHSSSPVLLCSSDPLLLLPLAPLLLLSLLPLPVLLCKPLFPLLVLPQRFLKRKASSLQTDALLVLVGSPGKPVPAHF